MSTRCQVKVEQTGLGWDEAVTLYHHYDGYPSNMLPLIQKGFELSGGGWRAGRAGKAASFLCAAGPGDFEPEVGHELHGDICWYYVVTVGNTSEPTSPPSGQHWNVKVYRTAGVTKGELVFEGSLAEAVAQRDRIGR
jgi:hypothetical protein